MNSKKHIEYYDSGKKREEYCLDDKNRKQGVSNSFYKTGAIQLSTTYKNDLWHGKSFQQNQDGTMLISAFLKNNNRFGQQKRY